MLKSDFNKKQRILIEKMEKILPPHIFANWLKRAIKLGVDLEAVWEVKKLKRKPSWKL